jgi:hypothetical protein
MSIADRHVGTQVKVVSFPWLGPESNCIDAAKGRGCLLVRGAATDAHVNVCDESLPYSGECCDATGH